MLFNIIKFIVLMFIAIYELIYINDPFINYLSYAVLVGSIIMFMLGMMTPQMK